ncbi:cytoplasmic protein NCK2-like, partial [Saccoglossus kowalevskii]|uniref:Cytoplasmic protein NCK2-like n=1 Tax=Saccoglossus kowalevskii TaxID=10224 RepID=A0ABM0GV45_SACKO
MGDEQQVVAKWDYKAIQAEELGIKKNEKLTLIDDSKSWWKVKNVDGREGFVPSNYVDKVKKPKGIFERFISKKQVSKHEKKSSDQKVELESHSHPSSDGDANGGATDQIVCMAVVKFQYEARRPDELSLGKGEQVAVMERSSDGWWRGECGGHVGWFPSNYVNETSDAPSNLKPSQDVNRPPALGRGPVEQNVAYPRDFVQAVEALYTFQARNDEELRFEAGEHLDIIGMPDNDPEWWQARNAKGEDGLIPKNYVQVIPGGEPVYVGPTSTVQQNSFSIAAELDIVKTGPYADKDWFAGKITRDMAENILNEHTVDGDFLIRESETN